MNVAQNMEFLWRKLSSNKQNKAKPYTQLLLSFPLFIVWHEQCCVQGWTIRPFSGLVTFVPIVAYHICLYLPATFSQPGNGLIVQPRSISFVLLTNCPSMEICSNFIKQRFLIWIESCPLKSGPLGGRSGCVCTANWLLRHWSDLPHSSAVKHAV